MPPPRRGSKKYRVTQHNVDKEADEIAWDIRDIIDKLEVVKYIMDDRNDISHIKKTIEKLNDAIGHLENY